MTADRIFTQAYTVYLSKAKIQAEYYDYQLPIKMCLVSLVFIQYLFSFMLRSQV